MGRVQMEKIKFYILESLFYGRQWIYYWFHTYDIYRNCDVRRRALDVSIAGRGVFAAGMVAIYRDRPHC